MSGYFKRSINWYIKITVTRPIRYRLLSHILPLFLQGLKSVFTLITYISLLFVPYMRISENNKNMKVYLHNTSYTL